MASESSHQQSVYLITYIQADLSIVSSREEFAEILIKAFSEETLSKQWACCCERHKEGGLHYHLALKLNRVKR